MPEHAEHGRSALARTSLARHLARGAIGFGLIGAALALTPSVGAAALLLAPAGLVALRGCPTCWIAGLIETVSAGRLERDCGEDGCALRPSSTAAPIAESPRASRRGDSLNSRLSRLAQQRGGSDHREAT